MPEPRLAPLPSGPLKIGAEHFRKVVRRIECTKPLAGEGIKLEATEEGIKISATIPPAAGGGAATDFAGLSGKKAVPIALQICQDGAPATIYVEGYTIFQDLYEDTTREGTIAGA